MERPFLPHGFLSLKRRRMPRTIPVTPKITTTGMLRKINIETAKIKVSLPMPDSQYAIPVITTATSVRRGGPSG
jgi:hypothetical protein